jgi:hypothetical protein
MPPGEDFIPAICKIKHENIDKDINDIKKDIEEIKIEEKTQHEEIKDMIEDLSNEAKLNHQNLKNKIILVNKSTGDKIDDLNDFDKDLRGNGDPGVWETIRNIKKDVKIIMILLIIFIGGSIAGISLKTVKEKWFGTDAQKIEKVEPPPKVISIGER